MIRIALPAHLQNLAQCGPEVAVDPGQAATLASVLGALEGRYPMLRGTVRDQSTGRRRPYVRYFACGEDFSNQAPDDPLPEAVVAGREPLLIVGAIAGG